MGMDQDISSTHLFICVSVFLQGTSIKPSYFDVKRQGFHGWKWPDLAIAIPNLLAENSDDGKIDWRHLLPFIGYSNIWGGSGIRYFFAYFWDITWYYMILHILQWVVMETYHLSAMIFWTIFGWRHSTISRRSCFAWLTNFIASCTHLSRRGAMAAAWARSDSDIENDQNCMTLLKVSKLSNFWIYIYLCLWSRLWDSRSSKLPNRQTHTMHVWYIYQHLPLTNHHTSPSHVGKYAQHHDSPFH